MIKELLLLLRKELLLEWRLKYAFQGILLYLVSAIFIVYLSFNQVRLESITWNAIFWVILLFTGVNAIAKSFIQENRSRQLYYYSICSPASIILSKIIYNGLLMLLLGALGFFIYRMILGNPVQDVLYFSIDIVLASFGISSALTMVSGIASKTGNSGVLMAILSFPVIVPILLMVIKISKNALDGLDRSASLDEILILLAINTIVLVVSFVLFPYLWRS